MPAISIIVPVYNVEKHLHKCIDSILNQTFSDFEIILVDDGSPDNCPDICDEYANQDNRIKVIHKENGGLASARNAGMHVVSAQFVMFIDSDDYIHPQMCEIMYQTISNNPSAWVFCNMCRVDQYDNPITYTDEKTASDLFQHNPTYFTSFKLSLSGSVCNKIYNMNIIRANQFSFDEATRFGEDVPFDTPYCQKCNNIVFISKPLYFYRVVPGSLTNSYHADHLAVYLRLFKLRLPLIDNKNLSEFCDTYFYYFTSLLDNTMDKRNKMGFLAKMRYNHKMMNTDEFKYCVEHASGEKESPLFMKVVKKHNYYIFWIFQKISKLKNRLSRRKVGETK